MARGRQTRSTQIDAIHIHEKLGKVLREIGDGFCEYADGVDDASVAKELNCSKSSVMRIRAEFWGNLYSARRNMLTRLAEACDEIEALKTDNLTLRYEVKDLRDNFNAAMTWLSQNSPHAAGVGEFHVPPPTTNGQNGKPLLR